VVDGSLVGTLLRLVVSLAVVLVLLVLLARYLGHRQLGTGAGRRRPTRRRPVAPVEVVSRHGLSRGSSLAVVRAGGQLLLVGVTESSVSVLRELEEEPEPQELLEGLTAGQPGDARGLPGVLGAPAHGAQARSLSEQGAGAAGALVETLREWTTRRG
jgi:flagellar protein FliO/FliZ